MDEVTCGRRNGAGYECTGDLGHRGDCTWPVDVWIDGLAYQESRRMITKVLIHGGEPVNLRGLTIEYVEVPDAPLPPHQFFPSFGSDSVPDGACLICQARQNEGDHR